MWNTQKIGAIIIYLDILFTRDHFPAWLGTGMREAGGGGWEREDHGGLETAGTGEPVRDGKWQGEGGMEDMLRYYTSY